MKRITNKIRGSVSWQKAMKQAVKIVILLLVIVFSQQGFAQNNLRSMVADKNGVSSFLTNLPQDQRIEYSPSQAALLLGLDEFSNLVLDSKQPDQYGEVHYRYHQTYQQLPVENSMYIIHTKDGLLTRLGGSIVLDFDKQKMEQKSGVAILPENAIKAVLQKVNAQVYAWQSPEKQRQIKEQMHNDNATFYPTAELVWFSPGDKIDPANMHKAYKVDVYAIKPLSRAYYFVDVQTGEVIGRKNRIHKTDATANVATAYNGTKTIHTNFTGGNYKLQDITKGSGIFTQTINQANYTSTNNVWTSPNYSGGPYPLDVHYGVSQTYSFYFSNYNRNSINNSGFALYNYMDPGTSENAFWDGSVMTFGYLTTGEAVASIDIAGHELTHGLTQFTSNLNYESESGAINESMSDIFGKAIEFWTFGNTSTWVIGKRMNWPLRDMGNPNLFDQPDTYGGTKWENTIGCVPTDPNDECGVHTNSGVGNFMFYLLVNGGTGTNDLTDDYEVTGIGFTAANAILYRTETVYLVSTSNFANWRTACIQAARDLYGNCSNEALQVANAWFAVGVGDYPPVLNLSYTDPLPFQGYFTAEAVNSLTANGVVSAGAQPTSVTANEITLLPGFTVNPGSNFRAYVTPCTTSVAKVYAVANPNNPVEAFAARQAFQADEAGDISVTPNPFTTQINVRLQLAQDENVSIRLIDNLGKLANTVATNKRMIKGAQNITINTDNLSPGMYVLQVQTGNKIVSKKVVKMESK